MAIFLRPVFFLLGFLVLTPLLAQNDLYSYHRLQGTIGGQPVVMHLHRHGAGAYGQNTAPTYSGLYYYSKYDSPMELYGETTAEGEILLTEGMGWRATGTLRLRPVQGGTTTGQWADSSGIKKLPIDLRESYPAGTLQLNGGFFLDSLPLFPDREGSPQATASYTWLEPAAATETGLRRSLWKELVRQSLNDTALTQSCCETPREVFAQLRGQTFAGYRDSISDEVHPDSTDQYFMYNYSHDISTAVLYNDQGLLSLGITDYVYTGGAHGNYSIAFYTYNLKKRRVLTLADVFKPGYKKALETALTRVARRRADLKPGELLNSYYFVDEIPVTENFYLTGKGIVFGYPPYEIASYADGQVELFVPFSELRKWIR